MLHTAGLPPLTRSLPGCPCQWKCLNNGRAVSRSWSRKLRALSRWILWKGNQDSSSAALNPTRSGVPQGHSGRPLLQTAASWAAMTLAGKPRPQGLITARGMDTKVMWSKSRHHVNIRTTLAGSPANRAVPVTLVPTAQAAVAIARVWVQTCREYPTPRTIPHSLTRIVHTVCLKSDWNSMGSPSNRTRSAQSACLWWHVIWSTRSACAVAKRVSSSLGWITFCPMGLGSRFCVAGESGTVSGDFLSIFFHIIFVFTYCFRFQSVFLTAGSG